MKKILFLVVLCPFLAMSQPVHPYIKGMLDMEYWKGILDANHKLWAYGSLLQTITTLPDGGTIADVGTVFNAFIFVSSNGHVYQSNAYNNGGLSTITQITTDSSGTTISDANAVWGYESTYWIRRTGGTIWQGGNDYFNILETTGAILRPFQISPGGANITRMYPCGAAGSTAAAPLFGISSDSLTSYEWVAGSGNAPPTRTFTGDGTGKVIKAVSDGGNVFGYVNYYLIQNTAGSSYGHPWVIGNNWILMGKTSSATYSSPHDLYSDLSLTSPIKELTINSFVTLFVDSAHNMWENGGYNMQGQLGIGSETVNQYTYAGYPAYAAGFSPVSPVYGRQQIGTGQLWSHVNAEGFFIFYSDELTTVDSLYSHGRNKDNILGQNFAMDDNDYSNHPNCCDFPSPTLSNSRNVYLLPPTYGWTAPTWSAGSNQSISTTSTTLTASGSPPLITNQSSPFDVRNYTLASSAWTQVSGPNTATIVSPTSLSTSVTGLIAGTYVFQNIETDNNTGTNMAQVTITVSSSNCNCLQILPGSIAKLHQF